MKKLALLFVAMFISASFLAQEHLDFKDVAIDGNLDEFITKMENLGFALDTKVDNAVLMTGKFTGKNAELYIIATPKSNTVWKVSVRFPKDASWSSLKSKYFDYKELYKQKYGKPKSYEFFSSPYYEGDGYELQALKLEKCYYVSFYELEMGTVVVEISKSECIKLTYEDNINSKLKEEEENTVNLNDI